MTKETNRESVKTEQKRLEIEEAQDWEWFTSDERGQRIVYALLERAGFFRSSFSTNALSMAFTEGQRNEGLYVFAMLAKHASPTVVTSIMTRKQKQEDRHDGTNE